MKIKKAIFPVGGLGTRFLPATKSMPKEMLPIVDKPLIQYAVEEAANAGIEQFIFVHIRQIILRYSSIINITFQKIIVIILNPNFFYVIMHLTKVFVHLCNLRRYKSIQIFK